MTARSRVSPGPGLALALAFAMAFAGGCESRSLQIRKLGPGAATPGWAAADTTYPNDLNPGGEAEPVRFSRQDILIGRPVQSSKTSRGVGVRLLGAVNSTDAASGGHSDFGAAFEELRAKYGYDGLLNKFVDTTAWQLDLYFIRYGGVETIVGGVGFNFKDAPRGDSQPREPRSLPNVSVSL